METDLDEQISNYFKYEIFSMSQQLVRLRQEIYINEKFVSVSNGGPASAIALNTINAINNDIIELKAQRKMYNDLYAKHTVKINHRNKKRSY